MKTQKKRYRLIQCTKCDDWDIVIPDMFDSAHDKYYKMIPTLKPLKNTKS